MDLRSIAEIMEEGQRRGIPFWETVLQYDMEERQVSREESMAKMLITWQAMQDAADAYTGTRRSLSGLVGGDGMRMRQYQLRGKSLCGGYAGDVIAEALSMAESNACMRRIVAAPTAGACGVLPAVLLPLTRYAELTQRQIQRPFMWPAAWVWSLHATPESPAPPAAVRRRSARPRPWPQRRWSSSGAVRTP